MGNGSTAHLTDRGVVFIGGPEAETFLQNIITTDMMRVKNAGIGFGALLSPQGKILFEFMVHMREDGFLFDLPRSMAGDFLKRMTFYRLRAKVELADRSAALGVTASWGEAEGADALPDPRFAPLGFRAIAAMGTDPDTGSQEAYQAHRISLGVPEIGRDYAPGDAFPHDIDMDDLGGLDFHKGCYVGQEIVSRMEHRGTARRRIVKVRADTPLPASGSAIEAGGRPLGTLGSVDGAVGIALVRLDRASRAIGQGLPITAAGTPLTITLPSFARFGWPENVAEEEGAA